MPLIPEAPSNQPAPEVPAPGIFWRLWRSRRNWQMTLGALAAALPQVLVIYLTLTGKLPAGGAEQVMKDAALVLTTLGALGGSVLALFTTMEDVARKWGVITPPPGEPRPPGTTEGD